MEWVTHYKIGEVDGPVLRGARDEYRDFALRLEVRRGGPATEEGRVTVRFQESEVGAREDDELRGLARFIAERRLRDHFSKILSLPTTTYEATGEELEEFFREAAPGGGGWLEIPRHPGRVGF